MLTTIIAENNGKKKRVANYRVVGGKITRSICAWQEGFLAALKSPLISLLFLVHIVKCFYSIIAVKHIININITFILA